MFLFRALYRHIVNKFQIKKDARQLKYEIKRELLVLFLDDPSRPFSLHNICREGEGKEMGEIGKFWKQNMTLSCVSNIIKKLQKKLF